MKVHPRRRVVTFRVTEEEYQAIKSTCDDSRNCLSVVAREAVIGSAVLTPHGIEGRLAGLDEKLDEVLLLLQNGGGSKP